MNEFEQLTESVHAEGLGAEQACPDAAPDAISVEIYDQIYHLRGTDPEYIQQLAALVDAKMRAVAAQGATVDSLRVAVLASLNIADELVLMRERYEDLNSAIVETQASIETSIQSSVQNTRSSVRTLSGMLDELLDEPEVRRAG